MTNLTELQSSAAERICTRFPKVSRKEFRGDITLTVAADELAEVMNFAKERGMVGIKGHRSVGGFRASIYNACPVESVQALVDCMKEFEALKK